MAEATPEQLSAGEPHGLTPELCARLRGETPDELSADAEAFVEAWGTPAPPPALPPRVGGPRGGDVGSGNARGTVGAGAALYRERQGIDEDGKRPERKPIPSRGGNPFATRTYTLESK
ncbi:hypothetical protein OG883_35700 [Streptomyces sp. NBC_01142]|uniref:hypothetical protein n=1 Tax=Streptomyces sp. NBC_01142 TaxID=2975865 RepID=UPI00225302C3|nr:hypothetical protein [Streptomyces sp. NBC_01142]MCX4825116.1 hypothetical protein [Streptomyces sp. NBC_01142]